MLIKFRKPHNSFIPKEYTKLSIINAFEKEEEVCFEYLYIELS